MPARKVNLDGYIFDSVAESRRYKDLRILLHAGKISNLEVHPQFEVMPRRVLHKRKTLSAIHYTGDFAYMRNGVRIIEDVKAKRTGEFNLRWKLLHHKFADLISAGRLSCELVDAKDYRS